MRPDMRVVVVVAHPDPNSFNHAIAATATASLIRGGHDVTMLDLYDEGVPHGDEPRRATGVPQRSTDPGSDGGAPRRHRQAGRGPRLRLPDVVEHDAGDPQRAGSSGCMVPGVGFVFDEHHHVRRGLTHVHRIVGISTYGARWSVREGDPRQRTPNAAARAAAQHGAAHTSIVAGAVRDGHPNGRAASRLPAACRAKDAVAVKVYVVYCHPRPRVVHRGGAATAPSTRCKRPATTCG